MVAGYYLGKAGFKAVIFESKLAPGGGMWGGGMLQSGKKVANILVEKLKR